MFFDRLHNGWLLAREALAVVWADKKLMVFPVLSGIACLLVLLSFAVPLMNSDYVKVIMEEGQAPHDWLAYALLFVFYFVNYFVIIFFNSALVACAIIRLNGGEPTLRDGFGAAVSRLPQILGWALVSATVGVILKMIEDRWEKVGYIVAGLLGMAWGIITYFVVPVLVVEKVGPVEAVKRSFQIVKQTWGESLTANFSIGLIVFLACLVALIPGVAGFLLGGPALIAGIGLTIVLLLVIALVSATANVVIQAVLYQYAAHQTLPANFDRALLENAFVRK